MGHKNWAAWMVAQEREREEQDSKRREEGEKIYREKVEAIASELKILLYGTTLSEDMYEILAKWVNARQELAYDSGRADGCESAAWDAMGEDL